VEGTQDDQPDHPADPVAGSMAGRRLTAIGMGVIAAGFGAAAPWVVPDRCLWVGWVCMALFVPVGCITAFIGVRGRATELHEFSPRQLVYDAADKFFGNLFSPSLWAL
jgi:hypothetical protein